MQFVNIIKKAMSDPKYKEQFIKDPETILRKEGIQIPKNTKIIVHENTDEEIHVVIPKKTKNELTDKELQKISGGEWVPPGGWYPEFD